MIEPGKTASKVFKISCCDCTMLQKHLHCCGSLLSHNDNCLDVGTYLSVAAQFELTVCEPFCFFNVDFFSQKSIFTQTIFERCPLRDCLTSCIANPVGVIYTLICAIFFVHNFQSISLD